LELGTRTNTDFMKKYFSQYLDEKSRVKVNEYLQLGDKHPNIFALGDVTRRDEHSFVVHHVDTAVRNIKRLENRKPLEKVRRPSAFLVISLGDSNGLLRNGSYVLTGMVPCYVKKLNERLLLSPFVEKTKQK